jgi:hypothetical protein
MTQKPPKPIRDKERKAHFGFIASLPCVICGKWPVEVAHIRYSDAAHEKLNPGLGRKEDTWVVPLCADCHRNGPDAQHKSNEREWWERHGIDPLPLATALYEVSGNHERAGAILRGLNRVADEQPTEE